MRHNYSFSKYKFHQAERAKIPDRTFDDATDSQQHEERRPPGGPEARCADAGHVEECWAREYCYVSIYRKLLEPVATTNF